MRKYSFLGVILILAVQATLAGAASVTIRTGQVGGSPGACGGSDDSFHYYTPQPNCGQAILSAPFQGSDFAQACSGPNATVITPAAPPWAPNLPCDPAARWIASTVQPGSCYGSALSALYCAQFPSQCVMADSIRICWSVDDFLGDYAPSYPGANPGGIYVNGVDLGPAFSGPGSSPQYTAVALNVPLTVGSNSLAVYQRDAGCGLGGLILSATIYTSCGVVPVEQSSWGSAKSLFR